MDYYLPESSKWGHHLLLDLNLSAARCICIWIALSIHQKQYTSETKIMNYTWVYTYFMNLSIYDQFNMYIYIYINGYISPWMEGIQFPSDFPHSCPQCSHSGQFNQVLLPTFINDVGSNPSLMSWKNMGVIVRYTYNVAPTSYKLVYETH